MTEKLFFHILEITNGAVYCTSKYSSVSFNVAMTSEYKLIHLKFSYCNSLCNMAS